MGWKSMLIITAGPYAPSAQLRPRNGTHFRVSMRREVSLVTGVKNDPTRPQEDRQSGGAMVPDVKEREVSWSR
jgi:hypothetical protein